MTPAPTVHMAVVKTRSVYTRTGSCLLSKQKRSGAACSALCHHHLHHVDGDTPLTRQPLSSLRKCTAPGTKREHGRAGRQQRAPPPLRQILPACHVDWSRTHVSSAVLYTGTLPLPVHTQPLHVYWHAHAVRWSRCTSGRAGCSHQQTKSQLGQRVGSGVVQQQRRASSRRVRRRPANPCTNGGFRQEKSCCTGKGAYGSRAGTAHPPPATVQRKPRPIQLPHTA